MVKMHTISAAQASAAQQQPLRLKVSWPPNDCASVSSAHNDWGFFCDYFRQWWNTQPAFGATAAERDAALTEGGYRVVTSLDPNVQASATSHSLGVYGYYSPYVLPIAIVQPGTGRVLAMSVNRHYSLAANPDGQGYPNTVDQLIAGGQGSDGYQSGSTFKMFTMLAALESGRPLSTGFRAPSPLRTHWAAGGNNNCGGHWCPVNEPNVVTMSGYALTELAPARGLLFGALPAAHHLLLGHGLAVAALHTFRFPMDFIG